MKKRYVIEKRVGETPLQALDRLRYEQKIPESVPLAYAGRLDPMASGKLLVLAGEECKNQYAYHTLDKEYEFEVLLGFKSDTGDILGIAERGTRGHPSKIDIEKILESLNGEQTLPYPHYSSKTVNGKPLFLWTLEGRLNEITIPTYITTIFNLSLQNIKTIGAPELYNSIKEKIELIPQVTEESKALGKDFRRADIRVRWKELLENEDSTTTYAIIKVRARATAGTYMRTLAEIIGERLGYTGLAYSIKRTRIGRYVPIGGKMGVWLYTYR